MGDPAGIGPEIAVKIAVNPEILEMAEVILYGCPDILNVANEKFATSGNIEIKTTGDLKFSEVPIGKVCGKCGAAARETVIIAVKDALSGSVDAIVTAPMNKASVNAAGFSFTGHTELIADLCGVKDIAMMQSAGDLRVGFVTTHIPLKDVTGHIDEKRIIKVAELMLDYIKAEGIDSPRLAIAALNPHAGENGFMGDEDEKVVKPAVDKLRDKGVNIDGPFPPDTLFIEKIRSQYDGILSMYHDQGHIPFKMLAFDRGVNSTLGLPIIRTSVDHGTAFEIAWRGCADTGSLSAAVKTAVIQACKRKI